MKIRVVAQVAALSSVVVVGPDKLF